MAFKRSGVRFPSPPLTWHSGLTDWSAERPVERMLGSVPRLTSRIVGFQWRVGFRVWYAGIAQLVEHNLAKVGVAGSSPVSRSDCGIGFGQGREGLWSHSSLALSFPRMFEVKVCGAVSSVG